MTLANERGNLHMKRNHSVRNPHAEINAPPVPHRQKMTPKNKVGISITKQTRKEMKEFREIRALESYNHVVEYLLLRVIEVEQLILVFKDIFDLATQKEDHHFLQYGFNRKMTPGLRITFNELIRESKDG